MGERLGAAFWTAERDERLRSMVAGKVHWQTIGDTLGCSRSAARDRAGVLGARTVRLDRRVWTDDEVAILRRLIGTVSTERVADLLRRSVWSVRQKSYTLGLDHEINRLRIMADLEHQVRECAATIADLRTRLAAVGEVPHETIRVLRIMLAVQRGYLSKGHASALLGMTGEQLETAIRREGAAGAMEVQDVSA